VGREGVGEGVATGGYFVAVECVGAAALGAQASVGGVEVEDRLGAGNEVGRVFGGVEVFGGVVRGVETEER
jgi:hypothetical protein